MFLTVCSVDVAAQQSVTADSVAVVEAAAPADSVERSIAEADSAMLEDVKTIERAAAEMPVPELPRREKRDWNTWRPNPQRALWLAMVLPGAGQIYNGKYWKLPIFYGGIMGCLYAMNWNNMMYKDYSQAYLDIMDDDPTTQSFNQFLHLGTQINASNEERYKQIFKSRKDRYRRWRDLSFFCLLGVYALSVIDAYVDAELSEFDISNDLSLKVEPAVINSGTSNSPILNSSIGLQCSLRF